MDVFPVWAPALAKGGPGGKQLLHSPPLAPETKKHSFCNRALQQSSATKESETHPRGWKSVSYNLDNSDFDVFCLHDGW